MLIPYKSTNAVAYAGIGLCLLMPVADTLAQTPARQSAVSPAVQFTPSKESEKRFRKILGESYDVRPGSEYRPDRTRPDRTRPDRTRPDRTRPDRTRPDQARDDEKPGKRRKKARRDYAEDPYPDYSAPANLIEMSVRVAPSLNSNTADGTGDYTGFRNNGSGLRPSVGISLDYFFYKNRYAFSSGLWYTIRRTGYQMPGTFGADGFTTGAPAQQSVYNLQYLQVPLTVKLFANNLLNSGRLYVQTGGLLDIKLAERALFKERNGLYQYAQKTGRDRQYGFGDFAWLVGAGVQLPIGGTNALNIGLSYQRGLFDVARGSSLTSKNRTVAVEIGLKF